MLMKKNFPLQSNNYYTHWHFSTESSSFGLTNGKTGTKSMADQLNTIPIRNERIGFFPLQSAEVYAHRANKKKKKFDWNFTIEQDFN